ncbi:MAG: hypothetical protein ACI90E_002473, partial [Yoonia sp.]
TDMTFSRFGPNAINHSPDIEQFLQVSLQFLSFNLGQCVALFHSR